MFLIDGPTLSGRQEPQLHSPHHGTPAATSCRSASTGLLRDEQGKPIMARTKHDDAAPITGPMVDLKFDKPTSPNYTKRLAASASSPSENACEGDTHVRL